MIKSQNANDTKKQAAAFQPARSAGRRILAEGEEISNDTWVTNLNNNDLVVGSTGAGKTRYYVIPNLLETDESVMVTDTKGSLRRTVGPALEQRGYEIIDINFATTSGTHGYNPLDSISIDPATGKPNQRDIMTMADTLVPIESLKEPFWDYAAKNLVSCLIAFVMEALPKEEQTLDSVVRLLSGARGVMEGLLEQFSAEQPGSLAALKWGAFRATMGAEKMYSSILGIVSEKLAPFSFDSMSKMMSAPERIDFKTLGQRKTAVFLTVSDTDRSMDRVVNLFYSQALQALCRFADNECEGCALPVPVRLFLDDFATNCRIPDFDKIISVIRSRNIAVSIVLQSITQLETLYKTPDAMTIVNGCDHMLYLGGQDVGTARIIAEKAHKTIESIMDMPVDEAWLFERGSKPRQVSRFDLASHEQYRLLPEAHEVSADGGVER